MSETTSETGALTVEQAIASLTPSEPAETTSETAPEAPVEAAEEPTEPQGETSSPEDAEAEPVEPAEGEETEAEPEPVAAADPPKYWSQDAKAEFAKLSPELQAVVLAQEGPREEAAAKAKAEAADRVKAADAEMGKVQQLADQLAAFLPQAIERFSAMWGETQPDWVAYAQEHGADVMAVAKAQWEADLGKLQKAAQAKQHAEALAQDAYVKAEFAKLAEIAPDLADPQTGGEKRQAVTSYLLAQGFDQKALQGISAAEMLIAEKARRWDEAQAKLKAAPKIAPKPAPKAAPVRPAASSPAPNPSRTASNRFAQTRSVEDAVALLLAKKA